MKLWMVGTLTELENEKGVMQKKLGGAEVSKLETKQSII